MKKVAVYLCVLILFVYSDAYAQCTSTISTFPYVENFEAGNGNWTTGGTASSWQWGIINKPVIATAGGGQRAWATGGLTGSAYNDGEDSWLRSPCYNFSSLINPIISFKIFWETERQFDGATIEFSTNGGNTWTILGSQNSNANCDGENWFNFSPVRYLGNEPGWSGNVQPSTGPCVGGGGSGTWLTAKHKLNFLAGAASVRFRFRFGAGTSCNQYDGLAIDDVRIEETPANPAAFTFLCTGPASVDFSTVNKVCQTGVVWSFSDPASGSANTSTSFSPTHNFSGPGTYLVSMTATFSNAPNSTSSQQVTIVNPVTAISSPILCNGEEGSATVNVNPAGTYTYSWNSNPLQNTRNLTNVIAGNYIVTVGGTNVCPATATVTLTEPPALDITLNVTDASCTTGRGSISSSVTGGIPPYTYTWSTGSTGTGISNQLPGTYTLTVRDRNGCSAASSEAILPPTANIQVTPTITRAVCGGNNGAISLATTGGTAPYTYSWSTGQTTPAINSLAPGNYSVTVTDANGCSVTTNPFVVTNNQVTISIAPLASPAQCSTNNGSIAITPSGGTAPYTFAWSNGANTASIINLAPGSYSVTVTDANGCSVNSGPITIVTNNTVLQANELPVNSQCNNNNGSISTNPSGGTAPYTFTWSTGAATPSINGLAPGNYSVTVTDINGCSSVPSPIVISNVNASITIQPSIIPASCTGNNGSINLTVTGGTAPYQFAWSNGAATQNINSLATGNYSVTVTDANGCTSALSNLAVNRNTSALNISLGSDQNYCPGMTVVLSPGNQFQSYSWQDGSTASTLNVLQPGVYRVTVTDASGCIGADSVVIYSNCTELYFPSAFTPDGDSRNETFGALGDFTGLRDYLLIVYGRWGQEVFRTTDPRKRWNGTYKGKLQGMQSFVYLARYTIGNRLTEVVKGSVSLIK